MAGQNNNRGGRSVKPGTARYALALLSTTLLAGPGLGSSAETYRPIDPARVVERLPRSPFAPATAKANAGSSTTLVAATRRAGTLIEAAQRTGDARLLGYALATLDPWLSAPEPPIEVRLLHAIVLQARHEFTRALALLDEVIRRRPGQVQAWLTRAVIQQVRGRPAAALASCRALRGRTSNLTAATCTAGALRLTSGAPQAYRQLEEALSNASVRDRDILPWSLRLLADIAEQLNDPEAAGAALREALRFDPEDIRSRAAYTDLLLATDRPREVLALIPADGSAPALLLRRALAARRLGLSEAQPLARRLREHFAAEARRGERLHLREAARAQLELFDRPRHALSLALDNWDKQREPADARVLLAAAVAAGDPAAAEPVLDWLQRQGISDARLETLIVDLGSRRGDAAGVRDV